MPAVTGTVTGNNFPAGTATYYTYSTGSSNSELNGNLLTITDARGQVYLQNTYAATTNPSDLNFDRLTAQTWGNTGDIISVTYAEVTPSAANQFAITKAWANDRVGRVTEHFFDASNQLVMLREHTGFANPDLPTDDVTNKPAGKLRATDPDYFETRYGYNVDGHISFIRHPRGNTSTYVYEVDLNPAAAPEVRGNVREVHRQSLSCSSGFPTISEFYTYEPGRGNEHGEQEFVVSATDPNGNVTESTYDGAGNRTSTIYPEPHTREDMEYSALGQLTSHVFPKDQHGARREVIYTYANDGHLRETIEDPLGLAITTLQEYDAACNETRRVDPRGNEKLYTYNERNELVREEGPLTSCPGPCGGGGSPTRAYTDSLYDANMNLVRVKYKALDCDGSPQGNNAISTFYEYDILNEMTEIREEVASGQVLKNVIVLDANREPIVELQGEAATGADPFNIKTTVYDERGLVFREIRGDGSPDASTTQHDYDLNGNEVIVSVGMEGPTLATAHTYDCADRNIATIDPMGNRTEQDYDAVGNVVERRLLGELIDEAGDSNNTLLERTTFVYDTMNRVLATTREQFDPLTQTALGDGASVTELDYDGESRVVVVRDDGGHETLHDFDGAGRLTQKIDAAGNIESFTLDENGNITQHSITDVPSDSGTSQVGTWTNIYDERNNLVGIVDPLGSTRHNCYDSLGRLTQAIDPRGNRTHYAYDGAGRLLETTYELTDDGTGGGTLVGTEVTRQFWDDSNRLIAREDPEGNVTEYAYDSLDRLVLESFADGSQNTFTYDIHDNLVLNEDPNGTVLMMSYDGLNRRTEVEVDPGPSVVGDTTYESYRYDGRSLMVSAEDDDSAVLRSYDSLGALLSETQTHISGTETFPHTVQYERDGLGNAVATQYSGGRTIARIFDGLRRTKEIHEGSAQLVDFEYLGPMLHRRTYVAVGMRSDYTYDVSRRMRTSRHIIIGGATLDEREYTYDLANNKLSDEDLAPGGLSGLHTAVHDSLGRTVESAVSGSASTDRTVAYTFDGAGNRVNVTGDMCPGAYVRTGTDVLVHQYTETPCEDWSHDAAGNLVQSDGTTAAGLDRVLEYDHRGRLVRVAIDTGTVNEIELQFAYDALGRKIQMKRTSSGPILKERYVYDGESIIEEYRNAGTVPLTVYLYGDGLDERLEMVHNTLSSWLFEDELGSTTAIVHRNDASSTPIFFIERYAYNDYGVPVYFFQGAPVSASVSKNPYLFAGARWIPDARLYDLRTRHLDPVAGRFISRDTIGIWGDEENLGNGYTYVANTPDTDTDPTGEAKKPKLKNCHSGARSLIESALDEAERMARLARNFFNAQADRKGSRRKKSWNNREHNGREFWGKYNSTRFNRIRWNWRKIVQRCSDNRITFKCRDDGNLCGNKTTSAWTLSSWHAWIRLCKNSHQGFFLANGGLRRTTRLSGAIIVHEVSHNINAIGDKKLDGQGVFDLASVRKLASKKPTRASWNAENYEQFSLSRR